VSGVPLDQRRAKRVTGVALRRSSSVTPFLRGEPFPPEDSVKPLPPISSVDSPAG